MKCFLCRKATLTQFLNLGKQPLANKYPTRAQLTSEDFFPIKVLSCPRCRNVQLGTTVSRDRMFKDYYYLSSVNPALVRHFEAFAKKLKKSKFVVDVGSNDGILLKPLKKLGINAIGVDPSINVSKIANKAGLKTITSFFDVPCARKIRTTYGRSDAVIASSVFTHLEDPHVCIEAVKELIADNGVFIIEVEYIGNILKKTQFERFYLDRVFYYSLSSLKHLFELHGMYVADVERIEPHGGSLRVTARLKGQGKSHARVAQFLKKEHTDVSKSTLTLFKKRVKENTLAFKDKLKEYKKKGLRVAGYGAPARVATITNYGGIGPDLIEFIVDDSPLKQNRFSPGKHIPIVSNAYLKDHRPDVLVVFAYEYFNDIKKKLSGKYRFMIPIPPREVR